LRRPGLSSNCDAHAVVLSLLSPLLHSQPALAAPGPEPSAEARPAAAPASPFRLFAAPPALAPEPRPLSGLESQRLENLFRLPGDPDSVFSLGGPAPSGEPRVRLAVEVNEVLLKVLAPEPNVDPNDGKARTGGDWKPLDSAGRPYQLRFGARLIW
jgi:hypothetical protein